VNQFNNCRVVRRISLLCTMFVIGMILREGVYGDFAKDAIVETKMVRMIYLVPLDRSFQPDYVVSMERAAQHLQIWFRQQMRNGKTFSLRNPIVEVFQTNHPAGWYATHRQNGANSFQTNVLNDGFALTGGRYNDPNNIWVFYIDADLPCDQIIGAGSSVAVLASLRELAGRPSSPPCPNTTQNIPAICRWVGGLGHELGHALGLPHPPECQDATSKKPCTNNAIMWLGYVAYPDAVLLSREKDELNHNPFFFSLNPLSQPFDCSNLIGRGCSGTFAGPWDSTYGRLVIYLDGDQVRSAYSLNNGRITGSVRGTALTGEWRDNTGRGTIELRLSPDGRSFTGRWTRTQGKGNSGGEWSGQCPG
jgi:hypothetical protein